MRGTKGKAATIFFTFLLFSTAVPALISSDANAENTSGANGLAIYSREGHGGKFRMT
ncbi:MAG: hypothetical protein NWE99_04000 [Candidatus Bathyarchaeota archaeon]|nr:hypothetical protein [Candidatus Bathyarchaeota archaeon]